MSKISDWIAIGEVSAERDNNLKNYFYDAGVSKNLVNNVKQYLLLGRKGAGKTAVYLNMLGRPADLFESNDLVIGMSLQSYSWQAHNILINDLKSGGFQHRDSWRFVLCVESIRALAKKHDDEHKTLPKPLQKSKEVLERIFAGPIPSWFEMLGSKLFGLANAKAPGIDLDDEGLSVSGGEISFEEIKADNSLRAKLNKNIENLTNWLEASLQSCPIDHRVFLVFDRLDEAWIPDFINESKSIIAGLLHASEHLLDKLAGRIRPIVFLREDIFTTLDINDRNKLRQDCSTSLRWTFSDIEKLIIQRINFYSLSAKADPIKSLHELFHETNMRSRTPPPRHIYNRTMGRPRDMVAFLEKTFQIAKDERLFNPETGKILVEAIYSAEAGYSDYLYEELSDEWRSQNSDFHDYLNTLENLLNTAITTTELQVALTTKGLVADRAGFRSVARFLFENSIVGIRVGGSKQWRYRCFYPNQAFSDDDSKVIKVHPGLVKRLGLTQGASEAAKNAGQTDEDLADETVTQVPNQ